MHGEKIWFAKAPKDPKCMETDHENVRRSFIDSADDDGDDDGNKGVPKEEFLSMLINAKRMGEGWLFE